MNVCIILGLRVEQEREEGSTEGILQVICYFPIYYIIRGEGGKGRKEKRERRKGMEKGWKGRDGKSRREGKRTEEREKGGGRRGEREEYL